MARFLFVVPPLAGHAMATSAVARALQDREHDVAWVARESFVGQFIPPGAEVFPATPTFEEHELDSRMVEFRSVRGPEAYKVLTDRIMVPVSRAMVTSVEGAIESFQPDVVVVEQYAWGGWLAARRCGVPWATLATSLGDRRLALTGAPQVVAWTDRWLARLQEEAGLEPLPEAENSPDLVIFFTSRLFVGIEETYPPSYRFVGPAIERSEDSTPFPWSALEDVPRVLVSLGSLVADRGERFYEAVKQALGDLPVQVIVVAPERFKPFPENFITRRWIPQLKVLEEVDGVVSHAGPNTVHEALWNGLPLVVAPIMNDGPYTAHRLIEAGAGLRVPFTRPRAPLLRESVIRILEEPEFRRGADQLRESFVEAGGSSRAAGLLEQMVKDGKPMASVPVS